MNQPCDDEAITVTPDAFGEPGIPFLPGGTNDFFSA
jgi:hypothetical protein